MFRHMLGNIRRLANRWGPRGDSGRTPVGSDRSPHRRVLDCMELEDRIVLSGAPIAVDTTSTPTSSGNISSLTWSHTVNAGSNGILIVGVSIHQDHHTETVASITGAAARTWATFCTFSSTPSSKPGSPAET